MAKYKQKKSVFILTWHWCSCWNAVLIQLLYEDNFGIKFVLLKYSERPLPSMSVNTGRMLLRKCQAVLVSNRTKFVPNLKKVYFGSREADQHHLTAKSLKDIRLLVTRRCCQILIFCNISMLREVVKHRQMWTWWNYLTSFDSSLRRMRRLTNDHESSRDVQ